MHHAFFEQRLPCENRSFRTFGTNKMSHGTSEAFFGFELNAKAKEFVWEGDEEADEDVETKLQITQACLGTSAKDGERNVVEATTLNHEGQEVTHAILSLRAGQTEMAHVELGFLLKTTFKLVKGSGPVHISGLYLQALSPMSDDEEDMESDSEEETVPALVKAAEKKAAIVKEKPCKAGKEACCNPVENKPAEAKKEKPKDVAEPAKKKDEVPKVKDAVLKKKDESPKKAAKANEKKEKEAAKKTKEAVIAMGEEESSEEESDLPELIDNEASEDEDMESDDGDELDSDEEEDDEMSDEEDDDDEDEESEESDDEEVEPPKAKKAKVLVNGHKKEATPAKKEKNVEPKKAETPKKLPEAKAEKGKTPKSDKKGAKSPKTPNAPPNIEEIKKKLTKSPNLPKTVEKFKNFMKSAHRVADEDTVKGLWDWMQKGKK